MIPEFGALHLTEVEKFDKSATNSIFVPIRKLKFPLLIRKNKSLHVLNMSILLAEADFKDFPISFFYGKAIISTLVDNPDKIFSGKQ